MILCEWFTQRRRARLNYFTIVGRAKLALPWFLRVGNCNAINNFFLEVNNPAFWPSMHDLNWYSLVSFFLPGWRSKAWGGHCHILWLIFINIFLFCIFNPSRKKFVSRFHVSRFPLTLVFEIDKLIFMFAPLVIFHKLAHNLTSNLFGETMEWGFQ